VVLSLWFQDGAARWPHRTGSTLRDLPSRLPFPADSLRFLGILARYSPAGPPQLADVS